MSPRYVLPFFPAEVSLSGYLDGLGSLLAHLTRSRLGNGFYSKIVQILTVIYSVCCVSNENLIFTENLGLKPRPYRAAFPEVDSVSKVWDYTIAHSLKDSREAKLGTPHLQCSAECDIL